MEHPAVRVHTAIPKGHDGAASRPSGRRPLRSGRALAGAARVGREGTVKVALGISYRGQAYRGWQSQPGGRTVQDALEAALARFANQPLRTHCAGRTDAGVHALNQVVHVETSAVREPFSLSLIHISEPTRPY